VKIAARRRGARAAAFRGNFVMETGAAPQGDDAGAIRVLGLDAKPYSST